MKLVNATAAFFEHNTSLADSLALLVKHFPDDSVADITPAKLRDYLARQYLEEAVTRSTLEQPAGAFPEARTLLDALTIFFQWLDASPTEIPSLDHATSTTQRFAVLQSLAQTLPRAIDITQALTHHLASQRGAFTFSEFLTSFEEGGHSEYDIGDKAGEINSLEGYFRVLRVDGVQVEAEEQLTEQRVWPIIFPAVVAPMLDAEYILNLELIRHEGQWQIVNCGFAYPPATEI